MTGPTPRQGFVGLCVAAVFVVAGCEEPSPEDTVGTVTDAFMSIHVMDEKLFPFVEHKTSGFNERCEIAADSVNEDIVCYLEMIEGDVNAQTVKLQYNVPPDMCDYVDFAAYWYWNFESGFGPSSITQVKVIDASGTVTNETCLADGEPCGTPESEVSVTGGTCAYDYSLDPGLPNCCFGDYVKTVTVITPSGVNSSVNESKWNGSIIQCISGPAATDDEWPKMSDGIPEVRGHYATGVGVNASLNIKSPNEVHGFEGNFHTANFYTAGRHDHSAPAPLPATSVLPYAIDPLTDRSGSRLVGFPRVGLRGQDSFELLCLDRASEVKNRIRYYIRDWNTQADFYAYRDSEGSQGNADVEGDEGTECDYELPFSICNDHRDWDDIADEVQVRFGAGAGYDDVDAAARWTLFPNEPKRGPAPNQ